MTSAGGSEDVDALDSLLESQEYKELTGSHRCVFESFDSRTMCRDYPPFWEHAHKKAMYKGGTYISNRKRVNFVGGCPKQYKDFKSKITFTRWRMMELPRSLNCKRPLKTDLRPDLYSYVPEAATENTKGNLAEFYVNFADEDLFRNYGSKAFDQDEIMVCEHPILGSLREKLIAHQSDARLLNSSMVTTLSEEQIKQETASPVCDTPCIILGAERHLKIHTMPSKERGISKGLYGKEFCLASRSQVLSNCEQIRTSRRSNIICMATGVTGRGEYSVDDINRLLRTAYTAFRAAKACAMTMDIAKSPPDPKAETGEGKKITMRPSCISTIIHTGCWGCGSSGGNIQVSCLIQTLAARLAGIEQLVFHSVTPKNLQQALQGYKQLYALTERCKLYPLSSLIKTIQARKYPWGTSQIAREPLIKSPVRNKKSLTATSGGRDKKEAQSMENKVGDDNNIKAKSIAKGIPYQTPPPGAPLSLTLEIYDDEEEDDEDDKIKKQDSPQEESIPEKKGKSNNKEPTEEELKAAEEEAKAKILAERKARQQARIEKERKRQLRLAKGPIFYFFRPGSWACIWSLSTFKVGSRSFICAGQYMMAEKARLFGDKDRMRRILKPGATPVEIRQIGRHIANVDAKVWAAQMERIAMESLMAKFGQSLHLRNKLLATKNAALVYSCVDDEVWGNGLDFPYQDDQRAKDRKQWRGKNTLGKLLETARAWTRTMSLPESEGGSTVKGLDDHWITMDEIIAFCFPEGILFPDSVDRLFMISEHGPLYHLQTRFSCFSQNTVREMEALRKTDAFAKKLFDGALFSYDDIKDLDWVSEADKIKCRKAVALRGGANNNALLADSDIKALATSMLFYDILRVFECPKTMPQDEQEEFIRSIPKEKRRRPKMTKAEITSIFQSVPKDSKGKMQFEVFRQVVREIRMEWIQKMKQMFPAVNAKRKPVLSGHKSSNLATRLLDKKIPDTLTWTLTDRLIHKTMHQMTALEAHGEGEAVKQNVYLMRNALQNSETTWDQYCCIRQSQTKASYVKKRRADKDLNL